MNHANDPGELIAKALKGELSGAEQRQFEQQLRDDPALRAAVEEEQRLNHLIGRLPNVPISTNFTSLVLRAVRQAERKPAHHEGRFGWPRWGFARVAAGLAAALLVGVIGVQQYRQSQQSQVAQSVSAFTEVASVIGSEGTPPPEVFQDFEAIQRLSIPHEPELDLELLFALQK